MLEFFGFPEVTPYHLSATYCLISQQHFLLAIFFSPAWTEGNFKLAPSELESSSSLQFVQGFLAFSDNIVIHFLSSQNRYQDMIVKTLNCELRRAHVIRQPQQAKAERAAVRTPFLPFFIQKSREVWASNLLLPCHRTWHSNSVRRDSQ